jgi:hypothetical protein
MTNKVLALLLVLAFALTIPSVALGQTKSDNSEPSAQDWQGLRGLKPGKRLLVETKQGKEIAAKFVDVNGSKLNLSYGFDILSLEQREIQRVYLQKVGSSRKKKAIIGAVFGGIVGLVIGAKIGANIDSNNRKTGPPFEDAPTTGQATAIYSMLGGAAAGYGIGHLLGGKGKGKLIYESK